MGPTDIQERRSCWSYERSSGRRETEGASDELNNAIVSMSAPQTADLLIQFGDDIRLLRFRPDC